MERREEVRHKHQRLCEFLERSGLDAVVLTQRCNFAWYTAGGQNYVNQASDIGAASLVVRRDGAFCVTTNIERRRIETEELAGLDVEVVGYDWWNGADCARRFGDLLAGRRFAADAPVAGLPEGAQPLPADFDRLRWQLTENEVQRYREVGRATGEAIEAACRQFGPGGSEFELAGLLSAELLRRRLRPHVILVAGDERLEHWRHPIPADSPVTKRAMAVVCAERWGLICSATRLFCFGEAEAEWRRRQRDVCEVDAVAMAATQPGRTLGEIFADIQKAYERLGWAGAWQDHHQGGPTGYRTREAKATPDSDVQVLENQAFAWNPSLVAAKSEDTIIVTDEKVAGTVVCRPDILVREA